MEQSIMKREYINVNGVSFTIVDKEFAEKYNNIITRCMESTPLPDDQLLISAPLTMKQLFQAAGHDLDKIDFAVPQSWLNLPENKERYYDKNDPAVWSYETKEGINNIYGQPVFVSEAKEKMMANIIAAVQTKNIENAIVPM
jgi:hypothetical protein